MAQKKKPKLYSEAIAEIQEIIYDIENDELDVDNLSKKIKQASELFDICQKKLQKTEADVEKIMKSFED